MEDQTKSSFSKGIRSGVSGGVAMTAQVGSLMWLRTIMYYQYRHGGTIHCAIKHLYKDGGMMRFYRGVAPAMFHAPLCRFGDTAANVGVIDYLNKHSLTKNYSVGTKTFMASSVASLWRVSLIPLDTVKTTLQVSGNQGIKILTNKVKLHGVNVLFHGTGATYAASTMGHFPWFVTYNYLDKYLGSRYTFEHIGHKIAKNAFLGFSASLVADTVTNGIQVVKTLKQTHDKPITYSEAINTVIKKDGMMGLLGRGLKTRLACNAVQGMMFSVIWRSLMDVRM